MFSTITTELRQSCAMILDNQKEIAIQIRTQNDRLSRIENTISELECVPQTIKKGMRALQTAFHQIKEVSAYMSEDMCETLGKLSMASMDTDIM